MFYCKIVNKVLAYYVENYSVINNKRNINPKYDSVETDQLILLCKIHLLVLHPLVDNRKIPKDKIILFLHFVSCKEAYKIFIKILYPYK